jgi:hypothetical protein
MRTSPFAYWCLLLDAVGGSKYNRIGLAVVYSEAYENLDGEITKFEIV